MAKAKKIVEVYQSRSKNKDWRWRLKASNGNIVGASSEGFSSRANAKRNIKAVLAFLSVAEVEVTEPKAAKSAKPAKAAAKPAKVVKSAKPASKTKARAKKSSSKHAIPLKDQDQKPDLHIAV